MCKYTTVTPIITAFDNWLNKYSSCPNGNHKMLTVTQLRNKGKVKGARRRRGQQQGGTAPPCQPGSPQLPGALGFPLRTFTSPFREANLPRRKPKPATRGEAATCGAVNEKCPRLSKQTSEGKPAVSFRGAEL